MSDKKADRCPVCGRGTRRPQRVTWLSKAFDPPVMVTNVPATVCDWCGDESVTAAVAHELDRLARERPAPSRVVQMSVYEFANVAAELAR